MVSRVFSVWTIIFYSFCNEEKNPKPTKLNSEEAETDLDFSPALIGYGGMRTKPTIKKYPLSTIIQSVISLQLSSHLFSVLGLLYCPFLLLAIGTCSDTWMTNWIFNWNRKQ